MDVVTGVGLAFGGVGVAFGLLQEIRNRQLGRRLARMEAFLADLPRASQPDELVRRIAGIPGLEPISDARRLSEIVRRLSTEERAVFTLRFYGPMTLEDIGATLGLTRERVRAIELRVLEKIRDAASD